MAIYFQLSWLKSAIWHFYSGCRPACSQTGKRFRGARKVKTRRIKQVDKLNSRECSARRNQLQTYLTSIISLSRRAFLKFRVSFVREHALVFLISCYTHRIPSSGKLPVIKIYPTRTTHVKFEFLY